MDLTKAAQELNEKGQTLVDGIGFDELVSGLQEAGVDMTNIIIIGSHSWSIVRKDLIDFE